MKDDQIIQRITFLLRCPVKPGMTKAKMNYFSLLHIRSNYLIFVEKICAMEIPRGNSREDIKARKQIISDFYASWIAEHPDKKIWNESLHAYIHVKFQSINETKGKASISYESTNAVMKLTDILTNAIVKNRKPAKTNDKNQKAFDQIVFLYHNDILLLVGHQTSKDEYVQYCIRAKKKPAWDADFRARIKLP